MQSVSCLMVQTLVPTFPKMLLICIFHEIVPNSNRGVRRVRNVCEGSKSASLNVLYKIYSYQY